MNDTVNADMREFWSGAGAQKWLHFQDEMDANLLPFGRETMAAAATLPGESVLDVGCGCGDTTFQLARRVEPDGRVLGLDISQPMLAQGIKRASSLGGDRVSFECGDAQVFDHEPGAFDLVFSRFGVMFFDDPVAAFKNLRRALRPGGRLAFICWQPMQKNEWIATPLDIVSRHVPRPAPAAPDAPGPLAFADPDRVTRILTEAGFSDIGINAFETQYSIGDNLEEAVEFLMQLGHSGGAISQSDADDTTKSQIAASFREALVPRQTTAGITMGAATWIVTAHNP